MKIRSNERGFTLVEIMIVVAIIALLAAVAIPNVLRGRTSANESQTVGNLRALVASFETYRSVNNAYPTDWDLEMYGADCAAATAPAPDYGPIAFCVDLSSAQNIGGYKYVHTTLTATDYAILANPVTVGSTGTRAFYVDSSGTIEHCVNATATDAVAGDFTDGDESNIAETPTACD